MATSTLIFWKTRLNKANNMIIQDIWRWLDQSGQCVATNSKDNFQYIRNDLEISLKIDWPQELIDNELNPDYLSVEQDGKRYYYYIDSIEQVSQNTLRYKCSMDVLNTYEGNYEISEHSMIERQHEDRFNIIQKSLFAEDHVSADYSVKRSFTEENLKPTLYKASDSKIETPLSQAPYMDTHKWYLVYKSSEDGTDQGRPCIELWADEDVALEHGSATLPEGITRHGSDWFSVDIKPLFFGNNQDKTYVCALDDWRATISFANAQYTSPVTVEGGTLVMRYQPGQGSTRVASVNIDYISPTGDVMPIGPWSEYYESHSGTTLYYPIANILLESATGKYLIWDYTSQFNLQNMLRDPTNWTHKLWIIGSVNVISGIAQLNRTNSSIVKAIECPYCPIAFTQRWNVLAQDWDYSYPSDWSYVYNGGNPVLRTYKLDLEFKRDRLQSYDLSNYTVGNFDLYRDQLLNTEAVSDLTDPKIYHENTYKDAFIYDSSEYDIPIGEIVCTLTDTRTRPEIGIDYYQSNAISSDLGFRFTVRTGADAYYSESFGNVMLSNRNNELPLFTSEYLDYMKNGYNYDKEKMNRQAAQSTASMITSAASAAATAAIAGAIKGSTAGWVGAAVGGAIGLVAGGIAAINSNKQAESDIEQKINEKANRAYSVSAVNDRSLFDWYSDNKLHRMRFEPSEENKKLIESYYKLFGYSKGIYCKPNTDNRYFYNYVRGDVEIDGLDNQPLFKLKEAIAAKYKDGVYFIHNRAATRWYWDIDLACNNYEVSLLPDEWTEKEYND